MLLSGWLVVFKKKYIGTNHSQNTAYAIPVLITKPHAE